MNARQAMVCVLAGSFSWLAVACSQANQAEVKSAAEAEALCLAPIELRYSARALALCRGYASLDECPDAPALKADRAREEEAASCR